MHQFRRIFTLPADRIVPIAAFAMLLMLATGLAHALQFHFAHPSVDEYLAIKNKSAQIVPAGSLAYDGQTFRCGRFPSVFEETLDDYAAAYFGFILINPNRFPKLSLTLKRYAFAHECGHQYVGYDEAAADCYAVRRGIRKGWLDKAAMDEICKFISQSRGDRLHAKGAHRCAAMRKCFRNGRSNQGMTVPFIRKLPVSR